MRSVGAKLLDLVQQGQEFTITHRGKEVARLVPARPIRSRELARAAVRRVRERGEQLKFGRFDWSEWKSFREEGRT